MQIQPNDENKHETDISKKDELHEGERIEENLMTDIRLIISLDS